MGGEKSEEGWEEVEAQDKTNKEDTDYLWKFMMRWHKCCGFMCRHGFSSTQATQQLVQLIKAFQRT